MNVKRHTFTIKNTNDKEHWLGDADSEGNFNDLAIIEKTSDDKSKYIYYGQVKDNCAHGFGVYYRNSEGHDATFGKTDHDVFKTGFILQNKKIVFVFNYNDKDYIFENHDNGDWAFYSVVPYDDSDLKRGIRYLTKKNYLEFIEFNDEDAVFQSNCRGKRINVDESLEDHSIYSSFPFYNIKRKKYEDLLKSLQEYEVDSGQTTSKEGYERLITVLNGERTGLGFSTWEKGDFYIGEYVDEWRDGLGIYCYRKQENKKRQFEFKTLDQNSNSQKIVHIFGYVDEMDRYFLTFEKRSLHVYFEPGKEKLFRLYDHDSGSSLSVDADFNLHVDRYDKDKDAFVQIEAVPFNEGGSGSSYLGKSSGGSLADALKAKTKDFGSTPVRKEESKKTTPAESGMKRLQKLIGLKQIKEKVELLDASKGLKQKPNLNFAFTGNPGTGKTIVARLFPDILHEIGLLPTNNFYEVNRSDLVGQYIGETENKTKEVLNKALGGTLFIDEAYTLFNDSERDFGRHVVSMLLKFMEDHSGELSVILAGYPKETFELLDMNPGFRSRIPNSNRLVFEDYNEAELREITKLMIKQNPDIKSVSDDAFEAIMKLILDEKSKPDFANARIVRDILKEVLDRHLLRTKGQGDLNITIEDVDAYRKPRIKDGGVKAQEKLDKLIGLTKVKKQIQGIKNRTLKFANSHNEMSLHMAFLGNPGTGKTEVAKLIAEIYYQAGILPENKCICADASSLIGEYKGQTKVKTHEIIKRAIGGVLFIDEAYGLMDSASSEGRSFGDEAIEALLLDMETYQGNFCVILAGYTREIEMLLDKNPGFRSRIPDQNIIQFPDYNEDELIEIAKLMVKDLEFTITDDALEELKKLCKIEKTRKNFANARFVRNSLQGIITEQSTRTAEDISNREITAEDVSNYIENLGLNEEEKTGSKIPCISKEYIYSLPEVKGPVDFAFIARRAVAITTDLGEGTGFIISPDGYIVSNNHVIENAKEITVRLNYIIDEKKKPLYFDLRGEVVAANKDNDVAILKVSVDDGEELPYLTLVKEGEGKPALLTQVMMGGYPLGMGRFKYITLTTGKVQSINVDEHIGKHKEYIYLDLSGTAGNSGSAVVDVATAKVVGIFSGASLDKRVSAMLNFAVPTSYIWQLINDNEPKK